MATSIPLFQRPRNSLSLERSNGVWSLVTELGSQDSPIQLVIDEQHLSNEQLGNWLSCDPAAVQIVVRKLAELIDNPPYVSPHEPAPHDHPCCVCSIIGDAEDEGDDQRLVECECCGKSVWTRLALVSMNHFYCGEECCEAVQHESLYAGPGPGPLGLDPDRERFNVD